MLQKQFVTPKIIYVMNGMTYVRQWEDKARIVYTHHNVKDARVFVSLLDSNRGQ